MQTFSFPIGFAIPPTLGLVASTISEEGMSPAVLWILVPGIAIICVTIWGINAFGMTAVYHHLSSRTLLIGGIVGGLAFVGSLWVLAQFGMQQLIYGGLISCLVIPTLSLLLLKRSNQRK